VSGVNPATGPVGGGTIVTIQGKRFIGALSVRFGTTEGVFNVDSDTQITATSPVVLSDGVVDVVVTSPNGSSAIGTADQFLYFFPVPIVTGISPNAGPIAGGSSIIITGFGFIGATAVSFGNTRSPSVTVDTDTQVTAISPPANASGAVHVIVTTPGTTSAPTSADQFNYFLPAPAVTAINPTSGPAAGGTTVTVTGTGFTGVTGVAFGVAGSSNVVPDPTNPDTQEAIPWM
jgi:hypothetical protein